MTIISPIKFGKRLHTFWEIVKFLVKIFPSNSCLNLGQALRLRVLRGHHAVDFSLRDSACSVSIAAATVLMAAWSLDPLESLVAVKLRIGNSQSL